RESQLIQVLGPQRAGGQAHPVSSSRPAPTGREPEQVEDPHERGGSRRVRTQRRTVAASLWIRDAPGSGDARPVARTLASDPRPDRLEVQEEVTTRAMLRMRLVMYL